MKQPVILLILSVIFGILDYSVCELFVWGLKIPLFLDTIFCLSLCFFANPLWGIISVICYHCFDLLISHSFYIYHLYMLSAFCGCVTVWLYKKYVMKDDDSVIIFIGNLLCLSLIMCLVMSITGGIISRICAWYNGDGTEYTFQTQFLEVLFEGKLKLPLLDSILLRLPVNLIDRFITVFTAFGVYLGLKKISSITVFQ